MGIRAAEKALEKARIDPKAIDLIIYIGEEHKEYPLWTAAIKIQEEIGAYHAWGFDVAATLWNDHYGHESGKKFNGIRCIRLIPFC